MKPISIHTGVQETRWFVRVLVMLAVLAIIGAVHEWFVPSAPPFKGRWAWVVDIVFVIAGSTGLVFLWLVLAAALLAFARFIRRHTPELPSYR
ncbi:hypothetical protein [Propionivibrio sp.]|uniref:hypothetical protein n=1 Tax=Propionivibrio sp. TaxID=2212460 RepID=UPI0039E25EB1